MAEQTAGPVEDYYNLLKDGMASFDEDRLRSILSPDLEFEGPIAGRVVGAENFIKGVGGFAQTMNGLTMLHLLHAQEQAAALYDAEMPRGTVRFTEFFRVASGRIESLRLLYDGADYIAICGSVTGTLGVW